MLADSYYSSFDEVVTLAGMGVDVVMRQHGEPPERLPPGHASGP